MRQPGRGRKRGRGGAVPSPDQEDRLPRPQAVREAWAAIDEKNGFVLGNDDERKRLLRKYWTVPEKRKDAAVVLADGSWRARALPRRGWITDLAPARRGGSEVQRLAIDLNFRNPARYVPTMLLAPSPARTPDEVEVKPDQFRWFREEVYPHESSLRNYLRGMFPGVRDVDDVVQESFLRTWKAGTSQSIRSARGFLFTVARRLALDLIRSERRSPIIAVPDLSHLLVVTVAPNAADATTTAHEVELLVEAIESLPARCREIFVLRKLKGISQREIAAQLGLSEQTVQVQAARGMRRCEEFLRWRLKL